MIGFVQEYRAERALAALKAMAAPTATVLRRGHPVTVPAAELVPGDVVLLEAGRIVPADLRLLEAASLRINESALTGESVPVDKITERDRRAGRCRSATAATWPTRAPRSATAAAWASWSPRACARSSAASRCCSRQRMRWRRRCSGASAPSGGGLALVVLAICAIIFVTGLLRGEPALPMLLTALSLAVAAIPEALPAVVSISLALGARRMMAQARADPAPARRRDAGFGHGDLLRQDGHADRQRDAGGAVLLRRRACRATPGTGPAWDLLLEAMTVSHDATTDEAGVPVGDPTEVALLVAARQRGPRPRGGRRAPAAGRRAAVRLRRASA